MKGKRIITSLLSLSLLVCLLSGCKTSNLESDESNLPVITLGSDNYPPYNYLNEDGNPTGIDVDLATEAFKRLGYRVEVVYIDWEKNKELLESGKIDCIMACFSMEGRLNDYKWAGPYIASRQVIAVNNDSDIYTLDDLKDKNVAVQSTTKPEDILLNGNYDVGNLISLNHRELIFTFLQKGYVDAIGAHEESIIQYMKDYNADFRILEEPLMRVGIGVAFSKNDKRDLCEKLDKTLKEMRKDGTSKKIIGKYLSDPEKYLEVDDFAY